MRTAHYELRVSAFQECSVSPPESLGASSKRVGVEVSLTPLGELQVPANPYYALLIDREGNVYEATLGGCGAPLSPSLPEPQQIARGWITFDLPADAHEVQLTYAPELLGGPKEEASLQLQL